jgi:Regulator of chromosome condensation (RCC1) repeat
MRPVSVRGPRVLLSLGAVFALGCSDEFANQPDVPVTVLVAGSWPDTLLVGDTVVVTVRVLGEGGVPVTSTSVTWRSSVPDVLSIEPLGFTDQGASARLIARDPGLAPVAVENAGGDGLQSGRDSTEIVVMERWRSVSAGDTYTCGITSRLAAYCWGGLGQRLGLGDGLAEGSGIPVRVAIASGLPLFAVSSNFGHTCALASATARSGFPYCWGDNLNGTTGNGEQGSPTILPTPVAGGGTFTEIASGGNMVCAADADGTPSPPPGQLGMSNTACWGIGAIEGTLTPGNMTVPIGWTPAEGNLVLHDIAVGRSHGCGLYQTAAYCWGFGLFGELGDGQQTSHPNDPVLVAGAAEFTAIAAGVEHTCALDTGGQAYCWGGNATGELGLAAAPSGAPTPQLVDAGGVTFRRISAAGGIGVVGGSLEIWGHTCALSTDSLAYCWGRNTAGELGIGMAGPEQCGIGPCSLTPRMVQAELRFATISTGEGLPDAGPTTHTCGITATGALYCWGDNGQGQLGNPQTVQLLSRVLNPRSGQ